MNLPYAFLPLQCKVAFVIECWVVLERDGQLAKLQHHACGVRQSFMAVG